MSRRSAADLHERAQQALAGEADGLGDPQRGGVDGLDPELDPLHAELVERVAREQRRARGARRRGRAPAPPPSSPPSSGRSRDRGCGAPTAPSSRRPSASTISAGRSVPACAGRSSPSAAIAAPPPRRTAIRDGGEAGDRRVLDGGDDRRHVGLGSSAAGGRRRRSGPRPGTRSAAGSSVEVRPAGAVAGSRVSEPARPQLSIVIPAREGMRGARPVCSSRSSPTRPGRRRGDRRRGTAGPRRPTASSSIRATKTTCGGCASRPCAWHRGRDRRRARTTRSPSRAGRGRWSRRTRDTPMPAPSSADW